MIDVISGDNYTQWWSSAGPLTGSVFFNQYGTTNSISLIDDSLEILSFDFSEYSTSSGLNWVWNFYDDSNSLLGSESHTTIGSNAIQSLDLVTLGYSGVNTIQLDYTLGWMALDNLEYNASSVPEPSAIALMGLGLIGFAATRRKIKK